MEIDSIFFVRDISLILNALGLAASLMVAYLFLISKQGDSLQKVYHTVLFILLFLVIANSILNFIGYLQEFSTSFELFTNAASFFFPVLIHLSLLNSTERNNRVINFKHLIFPLLFALVLMFRPLWHQLHLNYLIIDGGLMVFAFNLYYLLYFVIDVSRIRNKLEGRFEVTSTISITLYTIWFINILLFLAVRNLDNPTQQLIRLNITLLFSALSFYVLLVRIRKDGFLLIKESPLSKFEFQRIVEKVRDGKFYRDPTLDIRKLADLVEIPYYKLSQSLNGYTNQNFNSFINGLRVEEVVEEMSKADTKYSIWGLAQNAGFNSSATFYKAFRKEMGCTPSEMFN